MGYGDILIIVAIVIGIILFGLYYLNKIAYKKMNSQQEFIDRSKQLTSIFVIDKKRAKIKDVNMPKIVLEKMPKIYKIMKLNFVQAKIGPQIMTLICDKKVFAAVPIKKNIKVELAGIYIVSMVGMKTPAELKAIKKAKKLKDKNKK